jgi:hypothetical protein
VDEADAAGALAGGAAEEVVAFVTNAAVAVGGVGRGVVVVVGGGGVVEPEGEEGLDEGVEEGELEDAFDQRRAGGVEEKVGDVGVGKTAKNNKEEAL